MESELSNIDIPGERVLVSGLLKYGNECYIDVSDIISDDTLTQQCNLCAYKVIDYINKTYPDINKIDKALFASGASAVGLDKFFAQKEESKYINSLYNFDVEKATVTKIAKKLAKLEIARIFRQNALKTDDNLSKITGDEKISDILAIVENPIFDLSQRIKGFDRLQRTPQPIFKNKLRDWIDERRKNPVQQVGIPTNLPIWDRLIGGGLRSPSVNVIVARQKIGKALSNDSLVYTEFGPKYIKDIKVGDIICHPNNGLTEVVGVFPQGVKNTYRVWFNDNNYVDCCEDHLWTVKFYKRKKYETLTTKELLTYETRLKSKCQQHRFSIPKFNELIFNNCDNLEINPYLLGILIGDGSITKSLGFTVADKFIAKEVKKLLPNDMTIKFGRKYYYRIIRKVRSPIGKTSLRLALEKLNLFGKKSINKHIPKEYLYSNIENRWSLLQGLMDTDGYISKNGQVVCYYSSSKELALNVCELVNSLGGISVIKDKKTKCNGKIFNSFVVRISFNDNIKCFRLPRKKNRCKIRKKKNLVRKIEKIEKIENVECTCIRVKAEDGLFLTNNCIVTHNSSIGSNTAYHVGNLGIPVLMLDTEMGEDEHFPRMTAMLSGVKIHEIETGLFANNKDKDRLVGEAVDKLESIPYDYINIAGQPFEETLTEMRRWLVRKVGLDSNGHANPCMLILDYLKIMNRDSIRNVQETQEFGFMTTSLVNFTIKYKIPCLTFGQTNRDGINTEDMSVVAGSDRIGWFATNVSLFKAQSADEILAQRQAGIRNPYNRKLINMVARHGPSNDEGDWINVRFHKDICRIEEGILQSELLENSQENEGGFVNEGEQTEF